MKLVWTTVWVTCFPENSFENIHFNFWSEHCNENCQSSSHSKEVLDQLCQYWEQLHGKSFLLPRCQEDSIHEETVRLFSPCLACGIRFLPFTSIIAIISRYSIILLCYVVNESSQSQACSQALLSISRSHWTCKYYHDLSDEKSHVLYWVVVNTLRLHHSGLQSS